MKRLFLMTVGATLFLFAASTQAQPPMVTFPTPTGTPGMQIPYNLLNGVSPNGDTAVDYGKILTSFGWQFDTFQATANGNGSLGRFSPTMMYDSFNPPNPLDVVSMPEDRDWVFHAEYRYQGVYDPADSDFILFAKNSPADSGAPLNGREDRMFALSRGADANSYSYLVGNSSGGWDTVASNLVMTNEEYADIDIHYRDEGAGGTGILDFYWKSSLVASASTGTGRYDLDFLQIDSNANVDGTESWRNFRLGAIGSLGPPVEGDYDGNGIVDIGDYPVWRNNLNAAGTPGTVTGDGDDGTLTGTPDGIVDQSDYAFWKFRFGADTPLPLQGLAGASVPEPGSFMLLAMGAIGLFAAGRRRVV